MSSSANPVVQSLRRLDNKFEDTSAQMSDFVSRQANGENPDPDEFTELIAKMATTKSAMQAQFQLAEKPFKTVLTEMR